ncbi:MAG: hypothetical protein DRJ63_10395 [Thermoprotei archaeon]|nr:MAG: hypothetical protein DRJ63_10395 [Thermoprotei archaeon]
MSSIDRILILTEDTYGKVFFEKIVRKLKERGVLFRGRGIDVKSVSAKPCDAKLSRVLEQLSVPAPYKHNYFRIVVVMDGDGRPREVCEKIRFHVPYSCSGIVKIVVVDYELEEWICLCLGIRYSGKPSVELSRYLEAKRGIRYRKRYLPRFADELDIDVLLKKSESFRKFYNSLLVN